MSLLARRRVPAWRRSRRPTSSGSRRSCSTSASCCSATSAGSTRKSPPRDRSPRGTRWLLRAAARPGGRRAARRGDVLEAVEPAADRAACWRWLLARRQWRRLLARRRRSSALVGAVLAGRQPRHHRRLELPGRRPADLLRAVTRSRSASAPWRQRRPGPRDQPRADRGSIFDRRVFWTVFSHNLGVLRRRPATRAWSPYFFPAALRARRVPRWRRGQRRHGSGWSLAARLGARSSCCSLWVPLHVQRRRRRRSANRYFMSTLRRAPVPAAADRRRSRWPSCRGSSAALFSGAGDVQPVLLVVPPRRAGQAGPAALAAGRADAGQRPADQHAAEPRARSGSARRARFQIYFLDDNALRRART
ncbi:MAG: hypothetical protein MZV64_73480 [Ignavibacteriales bacterium]|nr:hypothetical protein [Ignavibacteriales bacterium]